MSGDYSTWVVLLLFEYYSLRGDHGILGDIVSTVDLLARKHSEGYSSCSLCVCMCVCVYVSIKYYSHTTGYDVA